MDLQRKRVLVTGASRGIGREITVQCAKAGARVALVARNEQAIKELADELGGTAHPCDPADAEQVRELIVKAVESRKRSVRLLRRGVLFPMLRASSQRIVRVLCAGIPNR